MSWFSNPFRENSAHNQDDQENCVKLAVKEGGVQALYALAGSSALILGACKAFPKFNRSLSVSGKTALIFTPAFGTFFLVGELALNECAQHKKNLARMLARERAAAQAVPA